MKAGKSSNEWHKIGFSYPLPNQKVYAYVEDNNFIVDDIITYYRVECFMRVRSQTWQDKTLYDFTFWTADGDLIFGSVTHYSFELNPESPEIEGFIFNESSVCLNPIIEPTEKKEYSVELAQIGDYWLAGFDYKTENGTGAGLPSLIRFYKTKNEAVQYARKKMNLPTEMQLTLF